RRRARSRARAAAHGRRGSLRTVRRAIDRAVRSDAADDEPGHVTGRGERLPRIGADDVRERVDGSLTAGSDPGQTARDLRRGMAGSQRTGPAETDGCAVADVPTPRDQ